MKAKPVTSSPMHAEGSTYQAKVRAMHSKSGSLKKRANEVHCEKSRPEGLMLRFRGLAGDWCYSGSCM